MIQTLLFKRKKARPGITSVVCCSVMPCPLPKALPGVWYWLDCEAADRRFDKVVCTSFVDSGFSVRVETVMYFAKYLAKRKCQRSDIIRARWHGSLSLGFENIATNYQ